MNTNDIALDAPKRKQNLRLTYGQALTIGPSKLLRLFQQEWPEAFAAGKCLKVGITRDIRRIIWDANRAGPIGHTRANQVGGAENIITGTEIAIGAWTKRPQYLRACVQDAPRYDLSGAIVGAVTAEEAEYARSIEAEIKAHGHPINFNIWGDWQQRAAKRLWKKL
jgi:sRNA-binding protein